MINIKYLPFLIVLASIIFYNCLFGLCSEKSNSLSYTKTAINNVDFRCMDGYEDTVERWGLLGYSRYCLKDGVRHGKWIAFENSKLVIEGNYELGKKEGKWIWYHSDGSIYRVIKYVEGLEVKNKIINK